MAAAPATDDPEALPDAQLAEPSQEPEGLSGGGGEAGSRKRKRWRCVGALVLGLVGRLVGGLITSFRRWMDSSGGSSADERLREEFSNRFMVRFCSY